MKLLVVSTDPPVWAIESSFSEKDTVKGAGAWWHPGRPCDKKVCIACKAMIGKQWWTPKPEVAMKLAANADEGTRELIRKMMVEKSESIEASQAKDSSIAVPVPPGLSLLPFQRAGVAYALNRKGTLIGDEMGLGKTVQAIALTNMWTDIHRVLVVCPAFLRINWVREFQRWSTRNLKIGMVDRSSWPSVPEGDLKVVVMNYDVLSRHKEALDVGWDLVILDEAHYVKNWDAQRTKLALGIIAGRRLYLTGTPILNRPKELWTICNSLAPKIFPSKYGFLNRYCGPEEVYVPGRGMVKKYDGASNLTELQAKLRENIMVRRLKTDVLTELPAKRRSIVCLPQNGCADRIREEMEFYSRNSDRIGNLKSTIAILSSVPNDASGEYAQAVADLRQAEQVLFEEMAAIRHAVALEKVGPATEYIQELLDGGIHKVVVFCHHKDVASILKNNLVLYQPVMNTGDMTKDDRQASVDRFQNDDAVRVFIGTIAASGVGITLTAASTVVFVELDWNPSSLSQAEDRCHRISQRDSVNIYHLVFDESLDSKMAKMIIEKQEVMDKALDEKLHTDTTLPPVAPPAPPEAKRAEPEVSKEMIEAVHEGLRMLSMVCDGARTKDMQGFNGMDSHIGKELARQTTLTPRQAILGKKILKKYHGQLGNEMMARIYPDWKEK